MVQAALAREREHPRGFRVHAVRAEVDVVLGDVRAVPHRHLGLDGLRERLGVERGFDLEHDRPDAALARERFHPGEGRARGGVHGAVGAQGADERPVALVRPGDVRGEEQRPVVVSRGGEEARVVRAPGARAVGTERRRRARARGVRAGVRAGVEQRGAANTEPASHQATACAEAAARPATRDDERVGREAPTPAAPRSIPRLARSRTARPADSCVSFRSMNMIATHRNWPKRLGRRSSRPTAMARGARGER